MTAELATQVLEAGDGAIAAAVRVLAGGGLVAFPTETVYGLGADAGNGEAVARLYEAKGPPPFHPPLAHLPDGKAARPPRRLHPAARPAPPARRPGPLKTPLTPRTG